jgi:hypothetical protein
MKKFKTNEEVWAQYKRLLKKAFPKLHFKTIGTWNWHDVYGTDPYENQTFMRIYNAYRNTCEYYKGIDRNRFIGWI